MRPIPENETPWDLLIRIMGWPVQDKKQVQGILRTSHEKIEERLAKKVGQK